MSVYQKVCNILQQILAVNVSGLLDENPAYKIYRDLYNQLRPYLTVIDLYVENKFLTDHPLIHDKCAELIAYIDRHPDYNHNHLVGCNLLESHLQELLAPRFIKEHKDSGVPINQHAITWFIDNAGLNYDTDKITVQAGFMAIFFV